MDDHEMTLFGKLKNWLNDVRDQPVEHVLKDFQFLYEIDLGDGIKTTDAIAERSPGHVAFTKMKIATVMNMIDSVYEEGLAGKTCLDIACNCGVYSFALAERSMKWKPLLFDVAHADTECRPTVDVKLPSSRHTFR